MKVFQHLRKWQTTLPQLRLQARQVAVQTMATRIPVHRTQIRGIGINAAEVEGGVVRVEEGVVEEEAEAVAEGVRENSPRRIKLVAIRRGKWAEEIGRKLVSDLVLCLTN